MKILFVSIVIFLLASCSKENASAPAVPTSADRNKFIGTWGGMYGCGTPQPDTLIIRLGSGEVDFQHYHSCTIFVYRYGDWILKRAKHNNNA